MKKLALLAIIAGFAATPALAASQYFVVQKAGGKTCSVSTTKPDGTTAVMVGMSSYKTKAEATAAMKVAPECKTK